MKFATMDNGTRDGELVLVSKDLSRVTSCASIARTLQVALEHWSQVAPVLEALARALEAGEGGVTAPFSAGDALAPLPRAWQWLDGSAFPTHGELMQLAYDLPPIPTDTPLMYQGLSHQFAAGHADMMFRCEEDGIDFEAEFAVIVDEVPQGVSSRDAMDHFKLAMLVNDWSLRVLGASEMRTGFGWVQAKPPCSAAPVVVTIDELGDRWQDGRIHLPVLVDYNGDRFGAAEGEEMNFGFHELVAHAAATRPLCAGTIIGSGTVSNRNCRQVGSSCIAERRAIEKIDYGTPKTGFMRFGDRIRIEVLDDAGTLFGAIDQKVIRI